MVADRNVMAAWMYTCSCKMHCNGCTNVAWGCFGEEVAAGGGGGQLVRAAVAVHSFWCVIGSLMVFCNAWFAGVFESVVAGRTVVAA